MKTFCKPCIYKIYLAMSVCCLSPVAIIINPRHMHAREEYAVVCLSMF